MQQHGPTGIYREAIFTGEETYNEENSVVQIVVSLSPDPLSIHSVAEDAHSDDKGDGRDKTHKEIGVGRGTQAGT